MLSIWNDFLYTPLFNLLIWIYNGWAGGNLGWSIVYLTIFLRTVLLPFSLINEYNKLKNEALYREIKDIEKAYQNDDILKKQEIRKAMKQRRVQPWAKVVVLGIQALVLVLLYQVFISGLKGDRMLEVLYTSVQWPGVMNTYFYGFDLSMKHDLIWSGIVGVFLLVEIYMNLRRFKGGIEKKDLTYFILFPVSVFIILWLLPMVKSLFILTSLVFSVIVGNIARLFFQEIIKRKIVELPKE
ncbi:MAG: YidC/Oxa1 family membrane protein insertase [bacterium]|nr:YidC/Oxa1 family membrane protein insertase [bacterium]